VDETYIKMDRFEEIQNEMIIMGNAEPNDPSALYNGMVYPLMPMAMRGMIWYQGESNAFDPNTYACRHAAMLKDYRAKFQNADFSFYPVQLAPYVSGGNALPAFRLAQTEILELHNTCVGTAVDLWDPDSPFGEIHPRNKQVVGKRLSLCAQKIDFDLDVDETGPMFVAANTSLVSNEYRTAVSFRSTTNVRLSGIEKCTTCCTLSPFELLVNNNWVRPSRTTLDGKQVILYTPVGNGVPASVRTMWDDIPQCGIYDDSDMVAHPFNERVA